MVSPGIESTKSIMIADTYRLILTEGIFTVLLGIAVFFLLPDCKYTSFSSKWIFDIICYSSIDCSLALRKREVVHPSSTTNQLTAHTRERFRLEGVRNHIQRLQALALSQYLGILYHWYNRANFLSTNCNC